MNLSEDIVAIKDANIVIDLVDAGLFSIWFSLGIRTVTTDIVAAELSRGKQWQQVEPLIENGLFEVQDYTASDMVQAVNTSRECGISIPDATVLELSKKLNAILLTGDRKLRSSSENKGIRVHGVLWVIDVLVEYQVIEKSRATASLRLLLSSGARLPLEEVEKRLVSWSD